MKDNREKAAELTCPNRDSSAPMVVAKAHGLVAKKIISLARKNGVPVHEDRNLIEILSTIDLYEEIPAELYRAVAETVAYVYKMSGKM